MERLSALFDFAEGFQPETISLADRRLYGGLLFFVGHKLRPELDPGAVRLVLDIISELRPSEDLQSSRIVFLVFKDCNPGRQPVIFAT